MADNQIILDDEYLLQAENDATEVGTDFDPDADYAAPEPPLPDGWHLAKLVNRGVKVDGVVKPFEGPRPWGNVPATFWTMVEGVVVDPGGLQHGKRASGNVTTHVEARRHNSSSASMYYRAITNSPIPGTTQGAQMVALVKELAAEPLVYVRTQLEGQAPEASRAYRERKKAGRLAEGETAPKTYRGQKAFTDANGKLIGYVDDEATGERVVGRPVIQEVKPSSFVPPAAK